MNGDEGAVSAATAATTASPVRLLRETERVLFADAVQVLVVG
jgi:hypothetical protein